MSTESWTRTPLRSCDIAVVGGGSIGIAWAIVFARAGHRVVVADVDPQRTNQVPVGVRARLDDLAAFGLLRDDEDIDDIVARVQVTTSLDEAAAGAAYVQECAPESLEVKRELFRQLAAICGNSAILASSSSMIAASRFAADVPGRDRCLVVHPGNPPYLLPIAEVVPAPFTAPEITDNAISLIRRAGMHPIRIGREIEGFVFNRLQGALLREAYCLVRDGVATATEIDTVVREGLGRRWGVIGPFATSDLNTRGGIERHAAVMGPAYERMGADRGQHDPWTAELVATVAEDLHRSQPLEDWETNVARRDRKLMTLLAALQDADVVTHDEGTTTGLA